MARAPCGLVLMLLAARPEVAEAASYHCVIENITVVAQSNSATVTWDTSKDCEQVRDIVCYYFILEHFAI